MYCSPLQCGICNCIFTTNYFVSCGITYTGHFYIGLNISLRYTIEILPFNLRAKGFTLFSFAVSASLVFNQYINPIALKAIGWKYYVSGLIYPSLLSKSPEICLRLSIAPGYPSSSSSYISSSSRRRIKHWKRQQCKSLSYPLEHLIVVDISYKYIRQRHIARNLLEEGNFQSTAERS